MSEELIKYITVYVISMFKFIGGPALGAAYGLSFVETFVITVLGMMTTVFIISFFGIRLRSWIQKKYKIKKKRFTKRNRRIVYLWRNYGEFGVSFFTPVIFSPVIGTLLVTTLGGRRKKVITYMLISAIFWALTISSFSTIFLNILTKT
jgi:hypothetical protein